LKNVTRKKEEMRKKTLSMNKKKEKQWEKSVVVDDEMKKKTQVPHSRFANLQPIQVCFPSSFPNYDLNKQIEENIV
jgi:hypothetical protein